MPGEKEHPPEAADKDDRFCGGISVVQNILSASQTHLSGMLNYTDSFYTPYLLATQYFQQAEALRLTENPPADSMAAYLGLLENNIDLMARSLSGSARMLEAYARNEADGLAEALQQSFFELNPTKLAEFTARQTELLDLVVNVYPKAIKAIEPEYGFHFERGEHVLADETDRFLLYRVAPSLPGVETRSDGKPVLILPPYVLGANILGFLPGEQRSYAHCFCQSGDSHLHPNHEENRQHAAVQIMTGEDDARDTRSFARPSKPMATR